MNKFFQSYSLVATFLFVLASAVVSVRLLLLSRRTRRTPELYLGLGILGTAVLGYGVLIAVAVAHGTASAELMTFSERALRGLGQVLHDAGVTMTIVFVLSVFRPQERWAKVLAGVMLLSLWGGCLGWELENGFRSSARGNAFWWMHYATIWTYPLWTTTESYRYYGLMRRRVALGLAEPLVTNRFLVWGTASIGTLLAVWISSISFFIPRDPATLAAWSPGIQISVATVGVATVSLYYLTFFPPRWYRAWIARNAPVAATGSAH
jgi:hypothetical protein